MATVQFTPALRRFFPELQPIDVSGKTIKDILEHVEEHYPGMRAYLVDDQGKLRQHVNIFLRGARIEDETYLSDTVGPADEIFVMQALSGG